jgi:hypothetical protein
MENYNHIKSHSWPAVSSPAKFAAGPRSSAAGEIQMQAGKRSNVIRRHFDACESKDGQAIEVLEACRGRGNDTRVYFHAEQCAV